MLFKAFLHNVIPVDPYKTCAAGMTLLSFFKKIIDAIKAQSYAVTPFSSHGKAKMEQKLAPRSPSSGQYSGPRLSKGACDL